MQSIGIIREFETENFRVVIDAVEDFDVDLSFDETGETRRKLENGSLVCFTARARVFLNGAEVSSDYLGSCIYESLKAFMDHKECGKANRDRIRLYGRYQIYRKDRPYEHCLRNADKLRKRGFATRAKAEAWAQSQTVPYDIFESGVCGSYFAGMVKTVCEEARKTLRAQRQIHIRSNEWV